MAKTASTMLQLGTLAPEFRLPDTSGKIVSFADFQYAPALLVIFMCNHCPYVKHVRHELAELAGEYQSRGVAVVGINSNDAANYPDDGPANMVEEVKHIGYSFPYLYDETQAVAKAYRAACTPDIYLFDTPRRLVYRGQFDDSRPGNGVPVSGKDLREALEAVLAGKPVSANQKPSIGCNIKWKPGNEPEYSAESWKNKFLGLEIGGTKLQIVVGDGSAKIIDRRRLIIDRARRSEGIREQIRETLAELIPADAKPSAIGVGFGGPVDWKTGKICRSHQIEGWADFKLRDWLLRLSGLPVCVDNDANTATFGEALHGAGVGLNPVFYVTLGSGVGGGLVVDGQIYHGAMPGEAEIGHVRLDREGTIVESRCSGWAVDAKIRQLKTTDPASLLARLIGDSTGGEAKYLAPALQQGDRAAKRVLTETAEDLAFGLSHVVHLFHPEVIILGGGLSLAGEPLRAAVESALRVFTMAAFAPGPQIRLAALGEDAVPVGALELARKAGAAVAVAENSTDKERPPPHHAAA